MQSCSHWGLWGSHSETEIVGWIYELATWRQFNGVYTQWREQMTSYKPSVPAGSIRNLRPLYAGGPCHIPKPRVPQLEEDQEFPGSGHVEMKCNGDRREPDWVCAICDGGPGNSCACTCPTSRPDVGVRGQMRNGRDDETRDTIIVLLEALELIAIVDQGAGGNLTYEEMAKSAMRQARAAIAKARGSLAYLKTEKRECWWCGTDRARECCPLNKPECR
jgi:hypothetical protein